MIQVSETTLIYKEVRSVISWGRRRGWRAKIAVIKVNRNVELDTTYFFEWYDMYRISFFLSISRLNMFIKSKTICAINHCNKKNGFHFLKEILIKKKVDCFKNARKLRPLYWFIYVIILNKSFLNPLSFSLSLSFFH